MNQRHSAHFPPQGNEVHQSVNHPNLSNIPLEHSKGIKKGGYNPYQQRPERATQPPPTVTPYQHFARPKQPIYWSGYPQGQQTYHSMPLYPKGMMGPQQPKGIMSYFHDKNGQLDIDKMLQTVGQVANTYHQVSPILKNLGSFVKGLK